MEKGKKGDENEGGKSTPKKTLSMMVFVCILYGGSSVTLSMVNFKQRRR